LWLAKTGPAVDNPMSGSFDGKLLSAGDFTENTPHCRSVILQIA
jgi:hypothetical protein